MSLVIQNEAALEALAAAAGQRWRAVCADAALSLGLRGDLGAGKTAWVRALLRGLGHTGRVPSPTYTLIEIYEIAPITLIHIDLYRLADDSELDALGLRDWLDQPGCCLFTECPERAPAWLRRCDAVLELSVRPDDARVLSTSAGGETGQQCLHALKEAATQSITQGFQISSD